MAVVAVTPYVSTDFSVKIGTDNYEAAFSTASLVPDAGVVTWKGGTRTAVFKRPTSPSYTFQGTIAQDWAEVDSLVNYCLENGGETVTIVFIPNAHDAVGSRATFTFQAIVPRVIAGGDIDAIADSAANWEVLGAPVMSRT